MSLVVDLMEAVQQAGGVEMKVSPAIMGEVETGPWKGSCIGGTPVVVDESLIEDGFWVKGRLSRFGGGVKSTSISSTAIFPIDLTMALRKFGGTELKVSAERMKQIKRGKIGDNPITVDETLVGDEVWIKGNLGKLSRGGR